VPTATSIALLVDPNNPISADVQSRDALEAAANSECSRISYMLAMKRTSNLLLRTSTACERGAS
jgi:hypothetical protein